MCRGCEPIGQDREGFLAWLADSASHPDRFASVIVALAESAAVTDDRVVLADGTSPREAVQWDLRIDVVFSFWQCDKENHGWREGRR
jgi:hypothetical protein